MKKTIPLLWVSLTLTLTTAVQFHQGASPMLLRADETTIVYKGEVIEVGDRLLESSTGETKTVQGKIIFPSGNTFVGKSFTVSEFGTYQVSYKAYFGYEEVERKVNYVCGRLATDYFICDSTSKATYGEYSHNTKNVQHQGVILEMANGSEIKFDALIDVRKLTSERVLLDFIVDPALIGTNDFSAFTLRITDAVDTYNYVDIYVYDPGEQVCFDAGTHISAGYQGSFMGGYEEGTNKFHVGDGWGTPVLHSFHAFPKQVPTHNAKIYFDYQNQTIMASPRFTTPTATGELLTVVNDFKNINWYKSAVWGGFPSGKVRLSLIPHDFNTSIGRLLIKEMAGINFALTNELEDHLAPSIALDFGPQKESLLPKAEINKPYRIFPAQAMDNFDDQVEVEVAVNYVNNDGQLVDISIINQAFTPTKHGKYIINYVATDISLNKTQKTLFVYCQDVEALDISLVSSNLSATLFEEVSLPTIEDLTTTGGSGVIAYTRKLYDDQGQELPIVNDRFTPDALDNYHLVFTAEDYNHNVADFEVIINVEPITQPKFLNPPTLPPALIAGHQYHFDCFDAFAFFNNEIIELSDQITLTVNDQEITRGEAYLATGEEAILKYSVSLQGQETVTETRTIKIIDSGGTKDKENYFVGTLDSTPYLEDYQEIDPGTGEVVDKKKTLGNLLSSDSDGEVDFANLIDSQNLNFSFRKVEDLDHYETLKIKLTDCKNANNTITYNFTINDDKPKISFPGFEHEYPFTGQQFSFRYDDITHLVYNSSNAELALCRLNDQGETFKGFPHGVYVNIALVGVGGLSGIIIDRLGNQTFTNATGIKRADEIQPTIRLNEDVVTTQKIGETFQYPSATAYDVLSEIQSLTIQVRYGSGRNAPSIDVSDMTTSFVIDKYGTYDIVYVAKDAQNKTTTLIVHVSVKDTNPPTIELLGSLKATYAVNDVVTIPDYRVTDGETSGYILDVILQTPNGEFLCLLRDNSLDINNPKVQYFLEDEFIYPSSFAVSKNAFRVTTSGQYILRFVAYDSQYNKCVIAVPFTVK